MDKWRFWRICLYVYECVYVYMHKCVYMCDSVWFMYVCVYACMYMCACMYMSLYVCMHVCVYVCLLWYSQTLLLCTLLHNTVIMLWESIAHISFICFTNTLYHQQLWLPCCVLSLFKYVPLNGSGVVVTQIWPSPLQVHQTLWIPLYSYYTINSQVWVRHTAHLASTCAWWVHSASHPQGSSMGLQISGFTVLTTM